MRILYIDIDALRPDHLGCYGYHRNTSPQIDALASEGVRFTNCYTSDAPCLPSRTALYTGLFGIHSGVVGHGGTAADLFVEGRNRGFRDRIENECLPRKMQVVGLHTAMISPFGQRHAARQFYAGFNEIHNTGQGGAESAEEITPLVMKWMNEHAADDNWFLHLNYWDVHTPYRAPASYGNPFAKDPLPAWITPEVWQEHLKMVGPHKAQEINMMNDKEDPRFPRQPGSLRTPVDFRRMFDGYDTAIRYVDDQIGGIVRFLKEAGVYDETMIIVSADHGENMGELGIYGEHGTADQITCRVPLIVKGPALRRGEVDTGLHYSLDLAPTLAELFGFHTSELWDGQSYAGSLTRGEESGRDQLVISQCAHVCQRSVRFGPWLYMRTYHDGYHLFPKEMLYNIENDPHEKHDLASTHPELCREGAARLMDWHDTQMHSSITAVDPLWTVLREGGPYHARDRMAPYLQHLRDTGREWAIPELMRRHPGEKV
jgi:arylsulfatase A-like enzyme